MSKPNLTAQGQKEVAAQLARMQAARKNATTGLGGAAAAAVAAAALKPHANSSKSLGDAMGVAQFNKTLTKPSAASPLKSVQPSVPFTPLGAVVLPHRTLGHTGPTGPIVATLVNPPLTPLATVQQAVAPDPVYVAAHRPAGVVDDDDDKFEVDEAQAIIHDNDNAIVDLPQARVISPEPFVVHDNGVRVDLGVVISPEPRIVHEVAAANPAPVILVPPSSMGNPSVEDAPTPVPVSMGVVSPPPTMVPHAQVVSVSLDMDKSLLLNDLLASTRQIGTQLGALAAHLHEKTIIGPSGGISIEMAPMTEAMVQVGGHLQRIQSAEQHLVALSHSMQTAFAGFANQIAHMEERFANELKIHAAMVQSARPTVVETVIASGSINAAAEPPLLTPKPKAPPRKRAAGAASSPAPATPAADVVGNGNEELQRVGGPGSLYAKAAAAAGSDAAPVSLFAKAAAVAKPDLEASSAIVSDTTTTTSTPPPPTTTTTSTKKKGKKASASVDYDPTTALVSPSETSDMEYLELASAPHVAPYMGEEDPDGALIYPFDASVLGAGVYAFGSLTKKQRDLLPYAVEWPESFMDKLRRRDGIIKASERTDSIKMSDIKRMVWLRRPEGKLPASNWQNGRQKASFPIWNGGRSIGYTYPGIGIAIVNPKRDGSGELVIFADVEGSDGLQILTNEHLIQLFDFVRPKNKGANAAMRAIANREREKDADLSTMYDTFVRFIRVPCNITGHKDTTVTLPLLPYRVLRKKVLEWNAGEGVKRTADRQKKKNELVTAIAEGNGEIDEETGMIVVKKKAKKGSKAAAAAAATAAPRRKQMTGKDLTSITRQTLDGAGDAAFEAAANANNTGGVPDEDGDPLHHPSGKKPRSPAAGKSKKSKGKKALDEDDDPNVVTADGGPDAEEEDNSFVEPDDGSDEEEEDDDTSSSSSTSSVDDAPRSGGDAKRKKTLLVKQEPGVKPAAAKKVSRGVASAKASPKKKKPAAKPMVAHTTTTTTTDTDMGEFEGDDVSAPMPAVKRSLERKVLEFKTNDGSSLYVYIDATKPLVRELVELANKPGAHLLDTVPVGASAPSTPSLDKLSSTLWHILESDPARFKIDAPMYVDLLPRAALLRKEDKKMSAAEYEILCGYSAGWPLVAYFFYAATVISKTPPTDMSKVLPLDHATHDLVKLLWPIMEAITVRAAPGKKNMYNLATPFQVPNTGAGSLSALVTAHVDISAYVEKLAPLFEGSLKTFIAESALHRQGVARLWWFVKHVMSVAD